MGKACTASDQGYTVSNAYMGVDESTAVRRGRKCVQKMIKLGCKYYKLSMYDVNRES